MSSQGWAVSLLLKKETSRRSFFSRFQECDDDYHAHDDTDDDAHDGYDGYDHLSLSSRQYKENNSRKSYR